MRNRSFKRSFLMLFLLAASYVSLFISGCWENKPALLFHAGAGQRSSLDEVKVLFEKANPKALINFSYKGSGYFIADLTRSREGDLYMPGEEFYLLQAKERGFIDDYQPKRDIVANFVTVIITQKGNPKNIRTVEDFSRPGVKVGLGNPKACAIGLWHERTFKKANIWEAVRKNAVMSAKCIPELGNAVQHKAVDATIVWATTAILYLRDVEILPIAPKYRGIIPLPIAVLNVSKQPELAQILKSFILSPTGKAVFRSHAYAIETGQVDENGFCIGNGPTDEMLHWLVQAAKVVKDPKIKVSKTTVGPFVNEVLRQRASK